MYSTAEEETSAASLTTSVSLTHLPFLCMFEYVTMRERRVDFTIFSFFSSKSSSEKAAFLEPNAQGSSFAHTHTGIYFGPIGQRKNPSRVWRAAEKGRLISFPMSADGKERGGGEGPT